MDGIKGAAISVGIGIAQGLAIQTLQGGLQAAYNAVKAGVQFVGRQFGRLGRSIGHAFGGVHYERGGSGEDIYVPKVGHRRNMQVQSAVIMSEEQYEYNIGLDAKISAFNKFTSGLNIVSDIRDLAVIGAGKLVGKVFEFASETAISKGHGPSSKVLGYAVDTVSSVRGVRNNALDVWNSFGKNKNVYIYANIKYQRYSSFLGIKYWKNMNSIIKIGKGGVYGPGSRAFPNSAVLKKNFVPTINSFSSYYNEILN